MTYAQLALAVLQVALWLMDRARAAVDYKAGTDAEVAKASLAILRKTDAGKAIMEKIDAMSPAERDDLTDALGRAGQG